MRAVQNVGSLKHCTFRNAGTPVRRPKRRTYQKWTFRNSGTPVRRTRHRKSQKMSFQEVWDSCAQNTTSEISKNALSGILRLLCAEQDVGNLKKCTFRNSGTPAHRTQRRISQKNDLSGIMGLRLAEQNVRNLKKTHFQELWDSWIMDPGTRTRDPGSRILDPGSCIQDPGSKIPGHGSWVQYPDPGSWIQDPGQSFVPEIRLFLKNPLVRGSFAAWGRTFSQKMTFF